MDCSELQNSLYFWWRWGATCGVFALVALLKHYQQKLFQLSASSDYDLLKKTDAPQCETELDGTVTLSRDRGDKKNHTPSFNDLDKSYDSNNENVSTTLIRRRRHENEHNGIAHVQACSFVEDRQPFMMPTMETKVLYSPPENDQVEPKVYIDDKNHSTATMIGQAPKIERSQIVVDNPSHVTRIDNQAITDAKYKITKIITTVEVTLQPTGQYETSSVKVDSLSISDQCVKKSGDPDNEFGSMEIIDHAADCGAKEENADTNGCVNSILEAAHAHTIEEVVEKVATLDSIGDIIREAGLESSNLIFGIDYTASNKFQGENSFFGKSLHSIEPGLYNPYQQVISVLGKTLAPFANSGFIAGYGFGDAKTEDSAVFPLKTEKGFCTSFSQMLDIYNEITPTVILSGPTNFAPLISEAIKICKQIKTYHILVIVADGQVTNEQATRDAIVEACKYPLSIIVVGVGDGPWQMMKTFDESLPKRTWDNFHFVEFHKVTSAAHSPELAFAVQALVEIPDQYKKIKALGLLERIASDDE